MSKLKLDVIENDSNYVATIVKLPELKAVDGLDNLMLATVFGYNCLVGKDSDKGAKYIFFPAETVLNNNFLTRNNLYRKSINNLDPTKTGFFDESGRVKAVKFKGIVSSGFLCPISYLHSLVDIGKLNVGDTFHSIDGIEICKKFRSPQAIARTKQLAKQGIKQPKYDRVIPTQFRLHTSTPQFLRFLGDFREGDRIVITEKLHGTSAVFSNVLTKRNVGIIEKILIRLGIKVSTTEYYPLYSSRSVIKNKDINPNQDGGYYGEDIWGIYAKALEGKIEKGITLYGEIVGYTPSGAYIQQGYSYGCKEGESKFYVYRMTYTTPDGNVIEFTDSQIRQYCSLRSLAVVPLLQELTINKESFERLTDVYPKIIEVMCSMNEGKVPREGVVIRRDGQETYSAYKLKSQLFLTYETKELDKADSADMESIS